MWFSKEASVENSSSSRSPCLSGLKSAASGAFSTPASSASFLPSDFWDSSSSLVVNPSPSDSPSPISHSWSLPYWVSVWSICSILETLFTSSKVSASATAFTAHSSEALKGIAAVWPSLKCRFMRSIRESSVGLLASSPKKPLSRRVP